MNRQYESKMEGDRWWPIEKSTTIDGRLVEWMDENGATFASVVMADGSTFEVRLVVPMRERLAGALAEVAEKGITVVAAPAVLCDACGWEVISAEHKELCAKESAMDRIRRTAAEALEVHRQHEEAK